MKDTKIENKCKRGQKLCSNTKCKKAIPIHTYICSFCSYINKKEKKIKKEERLEIIKIYHKHRKTRIINKKNLQKIRDFYSRGLFEVSFFF